MNANITKVIRNFNANNLYSYTVGRENFGSLNNFTERITAPTVYD